MKTERSRAELAGGEVKLQMSAMIDVVFLLLTFFVFTLVPTDTESHLDTFRPRAEEGGVKENVLRINVNEDGLTLNGRQVSTTYVDRFLERLGTISRRSTVVVTCEADSPHARLISILDLCAKHQFANVALASR